MSIKGFGCSGRKVKSKLGICNIVVRIGVLFPDSMICSKKVKRKRKKERRGDRKLEMQISYSLTNKQSICKTQAGTHVPEMFLYILQPKIKYGVRSVLL